MGGWKGSFAELNANGDGIVLELHLDYAASDFLSNPMVISLPLFPAVAIRNEALRVQGYYVGSNAWLEHARICALRNFHMFTHFPTNFSSFVGS